MDALCAFLRIRGDQYSERMLTLLAAQHYDSESVQIDLEFGAGNLAI